MKKKKIEKEAQLAMDWLGGQPEVISVILAKNPVGTRHKHAPGFTRILNTEPHGVRLQTYGAKNYYEIFVNAKQSMLRDRWVAALSGGQVVGNGHEPNFNPQTPKPKLVLKHEYSSVVPTPVAIDPRAGQIFDVTPELAQKWLERNTRNRGLRDSVVQKYAEDMKAGRWMVTGDAIAFDTNGDVINGQHRLWAVFSSKMTIRMLVVFDLDPDAVRVLDDHLKRSLVDVMHISNPGVSVGNKHAATARMMMFNLTRTDRNAAASKTTRQEQMTFLEKHLPAIDFAIRECFKSKTVKLLTHTSICATIARASYTQNKERLIHFAHVIISGMPEGEDDKAAIIFRNWLVRLESQNVRAARDVIYRKCERALNAFLKKEQLQTLYESHEELFPLPEEVAPPKIKSRIRTKTS